MPTFRTGIVRRVGEAAGGVQRLEVDLDGDIREAILYPRYAAPAEAGDRVVLNTTATELGLGSGGLDFVVWNLAHERHEAPSGGHIMKLRYTPAQTDVLAVEAPESPYHDVLAEASDLEGMPVVAASLHSQLLPVVCAIRRARPGTRIVYVMTDGGALELGFSRTVRRLRELRWLAGTVTVGHAIGGDLEAVNVYSGLLAARHVSGAEIAVAGMGPGVVGTGTTYGTTALDLGLTLNAAATLGGRPVACLRASEGEARARHAGLSHHATTALFRVALTEVEAPYPSDRLSDVGDEASGAGPFVAVDAEGVLEALEGAAAEGLEASHMGRGPDEDPLFFRAAGVAGYYAAALLDG